MPQGERTDLACPRCGSRMGQLSVREKGVPEDEEPGFVGIGRECHKCGHRILTDPPLKMRCSHEAGRERVYLRRPRPSRLRQPYAYRCLRCKRILDEA